MCRSAANRAAIRILHESARWVRAFQSITEFVQTCLIARNQPGREVGAELRARLHAAAFDQRLRRNGQIPSVALSAIARSGQAITVPACLLDGSRLNDLSTYVALAAIARELRPSRVFEFGTYLGHATLTFAANVREAEVLTLDLPPTQVSAPNLNHRDLQLVRHRTLHQSRVFLGLPEASRIVELFGDSTRFNFEAYRGTIDLVYIDGGHSLPIIRSDTRSALALLSERGAVVWDDYAWYYPDVVRFLEGMAHRGAQLRRITGTNLVMLCRSGWPTAGNRDGEGHG